MDITTYGYIPHYTPIVGVLLGETVSGYVSLRCGGRACGGVGGCVCNAIVL